MKKDRTDAHRHLLQAAKKYGLTSLVKEVCGKHGVTVEDLTGGRRTVPFPTARAEIWAWLREEGWSYPRIADLFTMDHVSVICGVRRFLDRQSQSRIG